MKPLGLVVCHWGLGYCRWAAPPFVCCSLEFQWVAWPLSLGYFLWAGTPPWDSGLRVVVCWMVWVHVGWDFVLDGFLCWVWRVCCCFGSLLVVQLVCPVWLCFDLNCWLLLLVVERWWVVMSGDELDIVWFCVVCCHLVSEELFYWFTCLLFSWESVLWLALELWLFW